MSNIITLRPYQSKDVDAVLTSLPNNKKVMYQLPTGGGKTISFSWIVREYVSMGKRVLIIAHRKELIEQAWKKLHKDFGITAGIIKAGHKSNYDLPVQVASIQTLVNRKLPEANLVIIDEAHHSLAATYKKIMELYANALLLGVTATPIRTNGAGFKDYFNNLICGPSVKFLEQKGFLCPADLQPIIINQTLLNELKISKGDYSNKALSEIMMRSEIMQHIARIWYRKVFQKKVNKRTIVFCCNIAHSKAMCEVFKSLGVRAVHVDSGSVKKGEKRTIPKKQLELARKRAISGLTNGTIDVVCNVDLFTEGVDVPAIECIIDAYPTMSLVRYLQKRGRGSRAWKNEGYKKKNYLLLDATNGLMIHGYPNSDRNWSLEGIKKKKTTDEEGGLIFKILSKGKIRAISKDILDGMINAGDVVYDDVLMSELTDIEKEHIQYFDGKLASIKKRKLRKILAFHRLREYCYDKKTPPSEFTMQYIQRRLGYKERLDKPKPWWKYHLDQIRFNLKPKLPKHIVCVQGRTGDLKMTFELSKVNKRLPICFVYDVREKAKNNIGFWFIRSKRKLNAIMDRHRVEKNIQFQFHKLSKKKAIFVSKDHTVFFNSTVRQTT